MTGCNYQTTNKIEYQINAEIQKGLKTEISSLNDKVFTCIENLDIETLNNDIFSDTLRSLSGNQLKSVIHQLNMIYDKEGYKIKDELFIPHIKNNQEYSILVDKNTEYEYSLNFQLQNVDSYISLLTFNDAAIMLTLVYSDYGDSWKLEHFSAGQYSIVEKLPFDFYSNAIEKYNKGYYIDAGLEMFLANQGVTPNELMIYTKHQEMYDFSLKIDSIIKSKYIFPITIENIETKPKILQIAPQAMAEGIFPMIKYLTEIEISDTVNLKIENDLIQKEIGELFSGLNVDKKYIFYTATDLLPTTGIYNRVYGFVQTIEED